MYVYADVCFLPLNLYACGIRTFCSSQCYKYVSANGATSVLEFFFLLWWLPAHTSHSIRKIKARVCYLSPTPKKGNKNVAASVHCYCTPPRMLFVAYKLLYFAWEHRKLWENATFLFVLLSFCCQCILIHKYTLFCLEIAAAKLHKTYFYFKMQSVTEYFSHFIFMYLRMHIYAWHIHLYIVMGLMCNKSIVILHKDICTVHCFCNHKKRWKPANINFIIEQIFLCHW